MRIAPGLEKCSGTYLKSAITVSLVPQAAGGPFVFWNGLAEACEQAEVLGFDAIEVFHSDHDAGLVSRYHAMATQLDVLMTGGTDFHADPASPLTVGTVTLPPHEWERLSAARHRHRPQ